MVGLQLWQIFVEKPRDCVAGYTKGGRKLYDFTLKVTLQFGFDRFVCKTDGIVRKVNCP